MQSLISFLIEAPFFSYLNAREIQTLIVSLIIGLSTATGAIILAVPLAFLWHTPRFASQKMLRWILIIPLFIPPFINALTIHNLFILGTQRGIIDFLPHVAMLRSLPGVIAVLILSYYPLPLLLIIGAIRSLPQSLLDAANISARPFNTIKTVLIPLLMPSILSGFLLTFMFAFTTFDVPDYYNIRTFVTEIFAQYSAWYNIKRALLLSIIPVGITACITLILLFKLQKKRVFYSLSASSEYRVTITNKAMHAALWTLYVIILLIAIVIPLLSLIINGNVFLPGVRYAMFSSRVIAWNTFWIASIGGILITITAIPVYLYIYRYTAGRLITLSLFAIPAISYGIVAIMLFNRPSLDSIYGTPLMLFIAYTFRFVPLAAEILHMHHASISPRYLESASLHAPLNWQTLRIIVWPLYKPALFLGWAIGFWMIASELPITLLLQPPGIQLITSRIFIFIHYGSQEFTNTLTLILAALIFFPIALSAMLLKYGTHHKK